MHGAITGIDTDRHANKDLVVRRKQLDERAKKAERIIDKLNTNSNRIVASMGLDKNQRVFTKDDYVDPDLLEGAKEPVAPFAEV